MLRNDNIAEIENLCTCAHLIVISEHMKIRSEKEGV